MAGHRVKQPLCWRGDRLNLTERGLLGSLPQISTPLLLRRFYCVADEDVGSVQPLDDPDPTASQSRRPPETFLDFENFHPRTARRAERVENTKAHPRMRTVVRPARLEQGPDAAGDAVRLG